MSRVEIVGYSPGELSGLGIPNVKIVGGTNISFKTKKNKNTLQCTVYINNKRISFNKAMNQLQYNKVFRDEFIKVLKNSDFDGYFLEVAPSNRLFEFTLVNAPVFKNITADPRPFEDKFKKCNNKDVISFMNLSKTSRLIVPCPKKHDNTYTHIGNFIRNASDKQIHSLLKQIPIEVKKCKKPIWLSTSGLGVYWLHIRLDPTPKYYTTKKYKNN